MLCNDAFLTYLKTYGYCVVRLPRTDIGPLQILTRQGSNLQRIGDLSTVFIAGEQIPLPPIKTNVRAANISGQRTSDLSFGVGLSILASILGAMGGSKLGIDAQYANAQTAAFEFQDVYEDSADVARLDQYLSSADVNPFSHHVAQLLEADDIYVTTATIKSSQFTVEAKTSNGAGLELNIPEIQEIVGAKVKVSGSSAVTSKVTFVGDTPLVFGFQAIRLYFENGRYTAFEPLGAGAAGLRDLTPAATREIRPLVTDSAFANLA